MKHTPVAQFKRTKMIATVGPATDNYDAVLGMMNEGVNGFRLNFSHATFPQADSHIAWIRKASKQTKKPVAIILDLQGPKIRCGEIEGTITPGVGERITLSYKSSDPSHIPTQFDLSKKVKVGERVFIHDGKVQTVVEEVGSGFVIAKVQTSGPIKSKKGLNLPDTNFDGDILTKKDYADLAYATSQDIDYVALSFVQTAKDIQKLRKYLQEHKSKAKIIAKIETAVAVEHLEEIIEASDAVMVARGDLAVETPPESVPIVTRQIIGLCQSYGKISIVATQMLASMTKSQSPTRAEVSDVATAVIVGADAVMLSDETASGDFPLESVQFMKKIIVYTQENSPLKPVFYTQEDKTIQSSISSAVMTLAHQVSAVAIVAATATGKTALSLAAHRPNMPILMVSDDKRVVQQLAIAYGGKAFLRRKSRYQGDRLTDWLKKQKILTKDDIVVLTEGRYPGLVGGTDTIKVRRIQ